jgi:hypothetical protein
VTGRVNEDGEDYFEVELTSSSNNVHGSRHIGTYKALDIAPSD